MSPQAGQGQRRCPRRAKGCALSPQGAVCHLSTSTPGAAGAGREPRTLHQLPGLFPDPKILSHLQSSPPGTSSSPRGCAQTRLSRPGIETTRCFYLFLSPNTEVLPLPRARHTWEPGASPGSGRICIPGWLREATALPVSRSSHLLTPSGCGKCRLNFLVFSLGRKRAQIPTPLPGRCRTPPSA